MSCGKRMMRNLIAVERDPPSYNSWISLIQKKIFEQSLESQAALRTVMQ